MQTFLEWLEFNNSGVPWYANSSTPAIRDVPPNPGSEIGMSLRSANSVKNARQAVYGNVGVNSYKELPGRNVVAVKKPLVDKEETPGTITNASNNTMSVKWRDTPTKQQMTYPDALWKKMRSPAINPDALHPYQTPSFGNVDNPGI